jgi:hypothetical protein
MRAAQSPVEINARFRRSVRIDLDLDAPDALDGFYCPPSFANALSSMASHIGSTGQSAFTWTGPFGGGKSSLALVLASLLGGRPKQRALAEAALGEATTAALRTALPTSKWKVLPLIGDRTPLAELIAAALELKKGANGAAVLRALGEESRTQGLLIIVDELGRTLDAALNAPGELDFLQDLAELASRSGGRLVFVGILHQAFEEYAGRLQRDARDRWSKIQGRFVDLPIATAGDETLELLRRAINATPKRQALAQPVALAVARLMTPKRPEAQVRKLAETLAGAAPLHPITACLLGPMSRRRFGQNQRSVFGFLNSAERHGFQEFIRTKKTQSLLAPATLFDYLQANLEPSILASPDGKKWSSALEGLERIEGQSPQAAHIALYKTLAVLDLFKDRSGLVPSEPVLEAALDLEPSIFAKTLKDLQNWSAITFRRHSSSFAPFAGSDFDIEAAVSETIAANPGLDLTQLRALADLQPRLAKRHHAETGAMRWFDVSVALLADLASAQSLAPRANAMGTIVLAIPGAGEGKSEAARLAAQAVAQTTSFDLIVGVSDQNWRLAELARELAALKTIERDHSALTGDAAARREVAARITELRALAERAVEAAFEGANWFSARRNPQTLSRRGLQNLISDLAAERYPHAPRVLNELLNRNAPSSNAVAARTALMKRMVLNEGELRLGLEGYPAERGMYESLIAALNLYRGGKYVDPLRMRADPGNLAPMWRVADTILAESNGALVTAQTIYDAWKREPIGLKEGLCPVFFVAYAQTRRNGLALYREGVFQSQFDELTIEFLARDAADLQIRRVELTPATRELLGALAHVVGLNDDATPFAIAKELVAQYENLEPWTKRTGRLSPRALKLRDVLKRAADPNRLLFDDLSHLIDNQSEAKPRDVAAHVREGLSELRAAYSHTLDELKALLLRELDVRAQTKVELERLRERAATIVNLTGDFRFNAFAGRVSQFNGTLQDMEGLAGLAADRLPRDWSDSDRERAAMGLAELAQMFLRTETYARVKGRRARRSALALVVGVGNQPMPLFREFEVSDADEKEIVEIVSTVERALERANARDRDLILGALARVSTRYLQEEPETETPRKRQRK